VPVHETHAFHRFRVLNEHFVDPVSLTLIALERLHSLARDTALSCFNSNDPTSTDYFSGLLISPLVSRSWVRIIDNRFNTRASITSETSLFITVV